MVKTEHFSAILSLASADHAQSPDFIKFITAFNCYIIHIPDYSGASCPNFISYALKPVLTWGFKRRIYSTFHTLLTPLTEELNIVIN